MTRVSNMDIKTLVSSEYFTVDGVVVIRRLAKEHDNDLLAMLDSVSSIFIETLQNSEEFEAEVREIMDVVGLNDRQIYDVIYKKSIEVYLFWVEALMKTVMHLEQQGKSDAEIFASINAWLEREDGEAEFLYGNKPLTELITMVVTLAMNNYVQQPPVLIFRNPKNAVNNAENLEDAPKSISLLKLKA